MIDARSIPHVYANPFRVESLQIESQDTVSQKALAGFSSWASSSDEGTFISFDDWLGTGRMEVAETGVKGRRYLNCPTAKTSTGQATMGDRDVSAKHFTGQPLDQETNLGSFGGGYYARFVTRFMSPDWVANPEDRKRHADAGTRPAALHFRIERSRPTLEVSRIASFLNSLAVALHETVQSALG